MGGDRPPRPRAAFWEPESSDGDGAVPSDSDDSMTDLYPRKWERVPSQSCWHGCPPSAARGSGLSLPLSPKRHTGGQGNGTQPVPLFLPAELTTGKDLGGAEPRDSTNDSRTDEDGKPRHDREQGPGNREREAGREPALKRGKVSGGPGPLPRRQHPSCPFQFLETLKALCAANPQQRRGWLGPGLHWWGRGLLPSAGKWAPWARVKIPGLENAARRAPAQHRGLGGGAGRHPLPSAGPGCSSPLVDEQEQV